MKKNVLFNFIKKEQEIDGYSDNSEKKILKKDEQDHSYFLVHLPFDSMDIKSSEHVFSLQEHHISIYERMTESLSFMSQYHYTAIFKDQSDTDYKLHVYFDSSDNVTGKPIFSIQGDTKWRKISLPELDREFESLARKKCIPFIALIKEKLADHVAKLEDQYIQHEIEAAKLSRKPTKKVEYSEALVAIERSLNDLFPLVKHNKYQNILKIIRKIRSIIEEELSRPTVKEIMQTPETTSPELASTNSNSDQVNSSEPLAKNKTKRKKNKGPVADFNRKVDELNADYKRLAAIDFKEILPKHVDALLELHDKCNMIFLDLDEKKGLLVSVLNNLRVVEGKIRQLGEKILDELLFSNRFTDAKKLTPFHLTLNKAKLTEKGLIENNIDLLSFLINYCGLELSQSVTVNGKKCPSIVEYVAVNSNDNGLFMLSLFSSYIQRQFTPENLEEWPQKIKDTDDLMAGLDPQYANPFKFGRVLGKLLLAENPQIISELNEAMGLPSQRASHSTNRHRFHPSQPGNRGGSSRTSTKSNTEDDCKETEECLVM